MSWSIHDPGLPPLTSERKRRLTEQERTRTRRDSTRMIASGFAGALERGRAARRRWAAVPDGALFAMRRDLAAAIRRHATRASDDPLEIRASLILMAEWGAEVRDLVVEVEAIGLWLEVES